ncbi:hypothetical protein BOTBODRAFT_36765 [Botryobasidium botryosum FD-172 SS1]|uniref:DUF676 domain-containing protein n=1 Tax=Botryobasidium botryosum (strain FD-172 SS1) TaxID=930990 RepID=A0A067M4Z5_BOTB1|nr:hypothetical protein BOTBODRAFT_36765 [Botryobasidium botryosum FD-172 SS1]
MIRQVHLLVAIHGMWGIPDHLAALADEASRIQHSDQVELDVLVVQTNQSDHTYDGIDFGGERVVEEINERIESLEEGGNKRVARFSVAGYSLGGLLARYVIGILHARKFFDKVEPVNFNTFATPHIGLLRYPSFFSTITNTLGPKLLARTGEQFYAVDKWTSGKSLLETMSDKTSVFYEALTLFPQLTIYANAVNDVTVPYVTSAIELRDPFVTHETNGIDIKLDAEYSPLIESFTTPDIPPPPPSPPRVFTGAWFRSLKPNRPILPPFLQKPFPLNIVIYVAIPVLLPLAITFALFKLSSESRASRKRIQLLESDKSRSAHWLSTVFHELERDVGDAIGEIVDDPADGNSTTPMSAPPGDASQPIISQAQRNMAASLNALPNLHKRLAFIHPVRNSHATIICRDEKRFEMHKIGRGVLRHWRDNFRM